MNSLTSIARVHLSIPTGDCEQEFLQAVQRSEVLHRPWVFAPSNHEEYSAYLDHIRSGRKIPFLVRLNSTGQLAGVVNVSEPVMGVFRSAYLGFHAFSGFERQGYMTEGLALVINRALEELEFHRLEANIQPGNVASAALVSRLGFRKEGFSPRYLFINNDWRDHDRWAILSEEWAEHRERIFASWLADKRQSRDV
jgi:[ribosomal protein S5]-alanine N-acetyltransferase